MSARPHLLHLEIDTDGDRRWSLDCPYAADENMGERPCTLVEENDQPCPEDDDDEWEAWVPIPGCFARQHMHATGDWDDTVQLGMKDPSFPVKVRVLYEGGPDDAYVTALVPWHPPSKEASDE